MRKKLPNWEHPSTTAARKKRALLQALRKRGWSYQKIGKEYGISRQRVHQILKWEDGYKERQEKWTAKWLSKS